MQVAVDGELALYQQMIDSITDYEVIRLDDTGHVRTWHEGAARLFGYSAEEIVGRPSSVFYSADDVRDGRPAQELRAAAETGRCSVEGWRLRKDGSQFWASVTLTPMRGHGGTLLGFVRITRNHTDRREQEIEMRAVERMLDAITDYEVIRLDTEGMVRSWSPGAEKLKRYKAEEIVGHHVSAFYPEEDARGGMPGRDLAGAVRQGRLETEGWRIRKDGSRFWGSTIISPIRDDSDQVIGFVSVGRDLSDRREQEMLVQRQQEEILELSTPVIQVWDKVLVLPIIGTLDSARAARLTEGLLERVAAYQAEVAILDVSGVPAVDTEVAQHMLKTVEAARLMGATSILSGVRPETAQAIVHLGIDLGSLRSRSNLREALQLALSMVGAAPALTGNRDRDALVGSHA
jgi:rsbT co-antagonist protein RsbR